MVPQALYNDGDWRRHVFLLFNRQVARLKGIQRIHILCEWLCDSDYPTGD